jgi:hypothetical protein
MSHNHDDTDDVNEYHTYLTIGCLGTVFIGSAWTSTRSNFIHFSFFCRFFRTLPRTTKKAWSETEATSIQQHDNTDNWIQEGSECIGEPKTPTREKYKKKKKKKKPLFRTSHTTDEGEISRFGHYSIVRTNNERWKMRTLLLENVESRSSPSPLSPLADDIWRV